MSVTHQAAAKPDIIVINSSLLKRQLANELGVTGSIQGYSTAKTFFHRTKNCTRPQIIIHNLSRHCLDDCQRLQKFCASGSVKRTYIPFHAVPQTPHQILPGKEWVSRGKMWVSRGKKWRTTFAYQGRIYSCVSRLLDCIKSVSAMSQSQLESSKLQMILEITQNHDDPHRMLQIIADAIRQTRTTNGSFPVFTHIAIFDMEETDSLIPYAISGSEEAIERFHEEVNIINISQREAAKRRIGMSGQAARSGQVQWAHDVKKNKDFIRFNETTCGAIVVPLLHPEQGHRPFGAINVEFDHPDAFGDADIAFYSGVAVSVANIIYKALNAEAQRRSQPVIEALLKQLTGPMPIKRGVWMRQLLAKIVNSLRTDGKDAFVIRLDRLKQTPEPHFHLEAALPSIPLEKNSLLERCAEDPFLSLKTPDHEDIRSEAVRKRKVMMNPIIDREGGRAVAISAPLMFGSKVFGVITLFSPSEQFMDNTLKQIISLSASALAVGIQRLLWIEVHQRRPQYVHSETLMLWMTMANEEWNAPIHSNVSHIRNEALIAQKQLGKAKRSESTPGQGLPGSSMTRVTKWEGRSNEESGPQGRQETDVLTRGTDGIENAKRHTSKSVRDHEAAVPRELALAHAANYEEDFETDSGRDGLLRGRPTIDLLTSEIIGRVDTSLTRIQELARKTLNISTTSDWSKQLNPETFNLALFARENLTARQLSGDLDDRIEIVYRGDEESYPIKANMTWIRFALDLVVRMLKHRLEQKTVMHPYIMLEFERDHSDVYLVITDNGEPLTRLAGELMTNRYILGSRSSQPEPTDTLLVIARTIIRACKGELALKRSNKEKISLVLRLPLAFAEVP
jgi:hypothetical protein